MFDVVWFWYIVVIEKGYVFGDYFGYYIVVFSFNIDVGIVIFVDYNI